MKTETTQKTEQANKAKKPAVVMNPLLEKERGRIYFPEKLAKANEMLKTAKLPPVKRTD